MANVVKYVLSLEDKASPALKDGAKAADEYDRELQDVDKSQKRAEVSATAVASGVAAFGAAAVGAATAAAALAQDVADLRNDLIDAETRSGIAAETLAGLRLAAEGSGQSFGALTSGLDQFGVRISAAAQGTGRQAEAFKALGVSVTNADGSLRDGNAVLEETLAALNDMEPSAERSALAVDTLGRSGGKLLQALSGSELSGFVDLAREFGVGVGPEAAKAAGDWQRQMAELNLVIDGLKARLADLIGGADGIETLTDLLVVSGEAFATFWSDALDPAREFGRAVVGIFSFLERSIGRVGDALGSLASGDFAAAASSVGAIVEDEIKAVAALARGVVGLGVGGIGTASGALEAGESRLGELSRARLNTGEGGAEAVSAARESEREAALAALGIPSAGVQYQGEESEPEKPVKDSVRRIAKASEEAAKPLGDWRDLIDGVAGSVQTVNDGTRGLTADLGALSVALAESGEAMERETRRARANAIGAAVGTGASIAGQAARGNVGGAISRIGGLTDSAGLSGAGQAAAAVSGIGQAGIARAEETGEKVSVATANAVGDQIGGFFDGIKALFQALPQIFSRIVPDLVSSLISDFVPAILKSIPKLVKAIILDLPLKLVKTLPKAIFKLLKTLFVELPKQIGRQFVRALSNLPRRIGNAIRAALGLDKKDDKKNGKSGKSGKSGQRSSGSSTEEPTTTTREPVVTSDSPASTARTAQSFALAAPARSRLDIARPSAPSGGTDGAGLGGNPFRAFADAYDAQAGAYGTQPGLQTLRRS